MRFLVKRWSELYCAVVTAAIVGAAHLPAANAESSAARTGLVISEHILKTLDGGACLLGLDLKASAVGLASGRKTARFKVDVYRGSKPEPRKARPGIWIRKRGDSFSALDGAVKPGKRYRYVLVANNKSRTVLSRIKTFKVSKTVLCASLRDGDSNTFGGGLGTPTPRPTSTPTPTSTVTPIPPTPTPTPTATATPVETPDVPATCDSLSQLLNEWGLSGPCDRDGNGVVDAADLGDFLGVVPSTLRCASTEAIKAQWGQPGSCDFDRNGKVNEVDVELFLSGEKLAAFDCTVLNDLLGLWGQGGRCDLNSDGTTDGMDLGLFLGSIELRDAACKRTQTLLAAWGASGGPCDKDGSGTVDARDWKIVLESYSPDSADACVVVDDVLTSWSQPGPCDFNGDGKVGSKDLGIFIGQAI